MRVLTYSQLPLTAKFRHYLWMMLYHTIDHTLIFINWLLIHVILHLCSMRWLLYSYAILHHILIFTIHYSFHFNKKLFLYYAIKTIELMMGGLASFEKVFHWTKYHESLKKQFNWNLMLRYTEKLTLKETRTSYFCVTPKNHILFVYENIKKCFNKLCRKLL